MSIIHACVNLCMYACAKHIIAYIIISLHVHVHVLAYAHST